MEVCFLFRGVASLHLCFFPSQDRRERKRQSVCVQEHACVWAHSCSTPSLLLRAKMLWDAQLNRREIRDSRGVPTSTVNKANMSLGKSIRLWLLSSQSDFKTFLLRRTVRQRSCLELAGGILMPNRDYLTWSPETAHGDSWGEEEALKHNPELGLLTIFFLVSSLAEQLSNYTLNKLSNGTVVPDRISMNTYMRWLIWKNFH